jgi:hypothetical protein
MSVKSGFFKLHRAKGWRYCLVAFLGIGIGQAAAHAASTPENGSMELVCVPPIDLDLHLAGFSKQERLLLHLWAAPIKSLKKNQPLPVTATWCSSVDKCEAGKGTVEFKYLNLATKASGSYSIAFTGEHQHKEGAFTVVRRKQNMPFLCE